MRALGLLSCTLVLAMSVSGCGDSPTKKAEKSASKKVAQVDADIKIGVATPALVADTRAAIAALNRTPLEFRMAKLTSMLAQTYVAGCQRCTSLIGAAVQ